MSIKITTPPGGTIGTPVAGGTSGSVLYVDGNGQLGQNNANFNRNVSTQLLTQKGALAITNALTPGVAGTASKITTGDPTTKGLIVKGTSTPPVALDPLTVTGLVTRIRAADFVGLNNNDAVVTLTDSISGYSPTQATQAKQGTFISNGLNSHPVVRLNGSQWYRVDGTSLPFGDADRTVYAVIVPANTTTSFIWDVAGAGSEYSLRQGDVGGVARLYTYWEEYLDHAIGMNPASAYIIIQDWNAGLVSARMNGTLGTQYSRTHVATGTPSFSIGCLTGGSSIWTGDFAELLIFNTWHSLAVRQGIQRFLANYYNITVTEVNSPQESNPLEIQDADGNVISNVDASGNIVANAIGATLKVKEGTNAKAGTAVLVGGTVTVNTTAVTANSRIYLTVNTSGGTVGSPYVSARTAGTSFAITSTSNTDTSTVAWLIVEPA